jgi:hypothetical protein
LAALALLLLAVPATGQTVTGVVTDTAGAGVHGVLIEVIGAERVIASAESDSAGRFNLDIGRRGRFELRLSHIAYGPVTAGIIVGRSDVVDIEVIMTTGAIRLQPVAVRARSRDNVAAFYQRAERPGFGHFVLREEIESRPAARTTDLLRQIPQVELVGVRPPQCATCPLQQTIFLRSATGICAPTIYVDGMAIRQDANVSLDALLTSPMLEGIEVYRGVYAPPPLVARSQCGVVAFWTRQDYEGGGIWRRVLTLGGLAAAMLTVTLLLVR